MTLHPQRRILLLINLVCGGAVIASYAQGIIAHRGTGGALWGSVPSSLLPIYTVSMFSAAAGYLAFTYFVIFRLNPDEARVAGRFTYRLFHWLYAAMLVPSALWMPLTFAMLDRPSVLAWTGVRLVLAVTALASIALMAALAAVRPRTPAWAYRLALLGSAAFCVQTAVFDALVWTSFFPLDY